MGLEELLKLLQLVRLYNSLLAREASIADVLTDLMNGKRINWKGHAGKFMEMPRILH